MWDYLCGPTPGKGSQDRILSGEGYLPGMTRQATILDQISYLS